jgi:hypothetical protein
MEARPDNLYGESLRADIPRLEIKNLNIKYSMSPSCFSRMPLTISALQSEEPDRGDALNHVIQTNPQFQLIVKANEAIILMINSFVDFFIQYYCIRYTRELNPLILILKEIIFNSTTNESESFTARGYDELLHTILSTNVKMHQWMVESSDSELYFFPKNVGRQLLYDGPDVVPVADTDSGADAVDEHAVLTESRLIEALKKKSEDITQSFLPYATQEFHRKQLQEEVDAINLYLDDKLFTISTTSKFQKFEIFYLLFLSYYVLSMSGIFFNIQIQDLDEIIRKEIARGKPNSFILEFLPYDESKSKDVESRTVINIIKSQLLTFFFNKNDIYFMPSLRELQSRATTTMPELKILLQREADAGGSKRVNNKSRKNKYKHKYNHKYKKSRKNKRHRRKRTQSTQNKMF